MKTLLTAKLIEARQNGRNYGGEKEMHAAYSVVTVSKGELREVVTCRVYMGRSRSASTVYASLWANNGEQWTAGHGQAGGYGYHKESAAIDDAIRSAGFKLSHSVSGTGEHESALKACARAMGYRGKLLLVRH